MTFFGRRPHTDSRRKVDVKCVHLYIDDSGSRRPDRTERSARKDGMDYFALGGILINEEDIAGLLEVHRRFLAKWKIDGPLHSTRIRGRRGEFSWLGTDPARENDFLTELETMILNLPVVALACVIDRPGYVARYRGKYSEPWLLCKTAFAILVERGAK